MSLWEWLIVITFYFISLWVSRFVVLLLIGVLIGKAKRNLKETISEKVENLKGGLNNEL